MIERKLHWNTVNTICSGRTFFYTQTLKRPERRRGHAAAAYATPTARDPQRRRIDCAVRRGRRRLRAIADGQVTFAYRDRRDGNQRKELTIGAAEFLRRFLLHVTPPGLCRIRHYGFLSNRSKEQRLPRCRALLGQPPPPPPVVALDLVALVLRFTGMDVTCCPQCQHGTLIAVERILAVPPSGAAPAAPCPADSS